MLNAERGWRKRLSAYLGLISAKRLEGTLGRMFDLIITNSTVDEQVIRELSPKPKTLTITNGVDMEYFAPDLHLAGGGQACLYRRHGLCPQ